MKPKGIRSKKGEKWVKINDSYMISNLGRWYSIARGTILKQYENNWGYYRATLWTKNNKKNVFTHIKVVEHFGDRNGNYLPSNTTSLRKLGLSIDHINRVKKNNRFDNLEIVTHQENCLRKFALAGGTSL